MAKVRQSNLEMLRIVSMVLILMSHCDDIFGLASLYSTSLGFNKIISDWLHMGGQIGVGCFVLISGYFMIDQDMSIKKLLKIVGEVLFYTIGIWAVWTIYNAYGGQIIVKDCLVEAVYAFFPILLSHYWFVTAYIILMILSPFLNKLIYSLDYQLYRRLVWSLIILFVVLQGGVPVIFLRMTGRLTPIFIMYIIAGYIKRFGEEKRGSSSKHFIVAGIFYFLLFVTFYSLTFLGNFFNSKFILDNRYFYKGLNSPFIIIICIELFRGFLKTDIKYNKIMNEIASCTLGVYLIHMNRLVYKLLSKIFPIYKETSTVLILLYSVVSVIVIFITCIMIDYIRKKTVGKIGNKFLDTYVDTIQSKVKKITTDVYTKGVKCLNRFYND